MSVGILDNELAKFGPTSIELSSKKTKRLIKTAQLVRESPVPSLPLLRLLTRWGGLGSVTYTQAIRQHSTQQRHLCRLPTTPSTILLNGENNEATRIDEKITELEGKIEDYKNKQDEIRHRSEEIIVKLDV